MNLNQLDQAILDKFACFILCHGRPNSVPTYNMLNKHGYTGKVYIICDDEDSTLEEYKQAFGSDNVQVFNKDAQLKVMDPMDIKGNKRCAVYARNACFAIARNLGLQYFCELDDDYNSFRFRFQAGDQLSSCPVFNLDNVFVESIKFLNLHDNIYSVAFGQGGDYIGGIGSAVWSHELRRKCMNSWICDVDKFFTFNGTMNDDVNAYTLWGSRGKVFFTLRNVMINQPPTQQVSGGMTEMYKGDGTYQKSFYTVMQCPSFAYINMMGDSHYRVHHHIDWDHAVPKIISSRYKKEENE